MKIIVHGNMIVKNYVAPQIAVDKNVTNINGEIKSNGTITGNVYSDNNNHGTER